VANCDPLPERNAEPLKEESLPARVAEKAVDWTGSTLAFTLALLTIIVWAVTGPMFGFSDTWQLVINTGTTIVTFLMVFLLQRAQNKDSQAIHLKLNELVAATTGSSNRLIDAECLTEKEMELLKNHYKRLVELSQQEEDLTKSHSVEEAAERQSSKSLARASSRGPKKSRPSKNGARSRNGQRKK
jgi:low affinity Fe/Cu permease